MLLFGGWVGLGPAHIVVGGIKEYTSTQLFATVPPAQSLPNRSSRGFPHNSTSSSRVSLVPISNKRNKKIDFKK